MAGSTCSAVRCCEAIDHPGPLPAVLLIDELDRADDDFEAFLFELLAEASVTIPELGTVRASHPPAVVLTSNRTRDLHDALKRRCLYHWIDYPSPRARGRDRAPSRARAPAGARRCAAAAVRRLRVERRPEAARDRRDHRLGRGPRAAGRRAPRRGRRGATLGSVLKYREDQEQIAEQGLGWLVGADT